MPFALALFLSFQPLGSFVPIPIFSSLLVCLSAPKKPAPTGSERAETRRLGKFGNRASLQLPPPPTPGCGQPGESGGGTGAEPGVAPLPLPLPLRRRGLGRAPTGEWRASRTAEGSQEEASDSPPSRSGLQGSSYIRRDGSESCFLRGERQRRAPPGPPRARSGGYAGAERGDGGHPLPLLPPAIARVPKALGEGVVIDFQLGDLRGGRRRKAAA